MTTYVGGLRLRLIKDNFYDMVRLALDDLDWFASGRSTLPVVLVPEQIDASVEIKPNTIGISTENLFDQEYELGSNLSENRWNVYIDILAEDEAVGVNLSGDVFDILRGKISAISRTRPAFSVYDLPPNDTDVIFTCEIENIEVNRVREWDKPYNKYWWVVACEIVDFYYDDQI